MADPIDPRVLKVMEVSKQQPCQRDPAWHRKRYDFLTASELAATLKLTQHEIDLRDRGVIDLPPEKKVGQVVPAYDSYSALMRKKCKPPSSESLPGSVEMEWGVAYEHVVTELHQAFTGATIHSFNLIPHPTIDFLAASPDGISSNGRMVEIKCPYSRVPSGKPKIQYWMQMQLQMACCDMEVCDFLDVVVRDYGNHEQYLGDCYGEPDDVDYVYSRAGSGMPKGIMIERNLTDRITGVIQRKYYYPPVLHFANEREEQNWLHGWAAERYAEIGESADRMFGALAGQTETYHVRYWYIAAWHSVPVHRDRVWFDARLPDFRQFWDLVQLYRREGVPDKLDRSSGAGAGAGAGAGPADDNPRPMKRAVSSRIAPVNIDVDQGCLFAPGCDED